MHRTLFSPSLPSEIKQNRIRLFLEVMDQDPYLLERTFFHILSLPAKPIIFQCIDLVVVADRFAVIANRDRNTRFLTRCIIAVGISRLTAQDLDERRLRIIERWLSFRITDTTSSGQLASMKLLNLVWIMKEINSAGTEYKVLGQTLCVVRNLPVNDVEPEYQNEFCMLWNQILDSAGAVSGSNADLVLPRIRAIYNTLHGGINDFPVNATHTLADYPRCIIHTHRNLNPRVADYEQRD